MPDPLWEQYYAWSPYAYAAGNPVSLLDRDGRDVTLNLNGENVATIQTELFDYSMDFENTYISVPKMWKPIEFDLDQCMNAIGTTIGSSDLAGIGFQVSWEFTAGMGADITYQFINFIKGKDKNNGTFEYLSPSGRVGGFGGGLSVQALLATSDQEKIDRYTPEGPFLDLNFASAPYTTAGMSLSIGKGGSMLTDVIFGGSRPFVVYTFGFGFGGYSGGLGETQINEK